MNWEAVLSAPVVERVGWALVHFLWQGGALAIIGALVLRGMRQRSAEARYVVAMIALVAMAAAPVATMLLIRTEAQNAAMRRMAGQFAETLKMLPVGNGARAGEATAAAASGDLRIEAVESVGPPPAEAWRANFERRVRDVLPWLVLAWMLGVVALSARQLTAWGMVQRLRRQFVKPIAAPWGEAFARLAERIGVRRAVTLLESAAVEVPSVIGWLRPVVLLPASALTGLTPKQVEAILAHELAHIRRHDYLANIFQAAVETLLFYHPGVWWLSRRIRQEREHCCDDLAVRVVGDAHGYALALTRMEELRTEASAYAMALTGGNLMKRIQRLLGMRNEEAAGSRWLAGALAGLTMLVVGCLATGLPQTRANAQAAESAGTLTVAAPEPQPAPAQAAVPPTTPIRTAHPEYANQPAEKMAGFVAFDPATIVGGAKPAIEINMDRTALQIAMAAAKASQPDAVKLLDGIDIGLVKFKIYEGLDVEEDALMPALAKQSDELVSKGWSPIFRVADGGDMVNVLMKTESNRIKGLVLIIGDGSDLIYGNVVLDADANEVGTRIGVGMNQFMNGQLDLDDLGSLLQPNAKGRNANRATGAPTSAEAKDENLQLAELQAKEDLMKKKLESLQQTYSEEHWEVKQAREALAQLQKEIDQRQSGAEAGHENSARVNPRNATTETTAEAAPSRRVMQVQMKEDLLKQRLAELRQTKTSEDPAVKEMETALAKTIRERKEMQAGEQIMSLHHQNKETKRQLELLEAQVQKQGVNTSEREQLETNIEAARVQLQTTNRQLELLRKISEQRLNEAKPEANSGNAELGTRMNQFMSGELDSDNPGKLLLPQPGANRGNQQNPRPPGVLDVKPLNQTKMEPQAEELTQDRADGPQLLMNFTQGVELEKELALGMLAAMEVPIDLVQLGIKARARNYPNAQLEHEIASEVVSALNLPISLLKTWVEVQSHGTSSSAESTRTRRE